MKIDSISAIIGVILIVFYILLRLIKKQTLTLFDISVIFASNFAAIHSSFLGYKVCFTQINMGDLINYRIFIILGSITIIFISFKAVIDCFTISK